MKRLMISFILMMMLTGCSSGDDPKPDPVPEKKPGKATLLSPENNSECVEGTIINDEKAKIDFKWNKAQNADSYSISIKNLQTGSRINKSVSVNNFSIELKRANPYSWQVTSKSSSSDVTAKSDTWKFYVAGISETSYAPFPADLLSPLNNASVTAVDHKISLDWKAEDVDNDIQSFDVYLGESNPPGLLKSDITDSELSGVEVTSGKEYYWKIVTKDSKGNSSVSEISHFKVQ